MPRARLLIRRGTAHEAARHDAFELDFAPGESLLDGLRRLRAEVDATLAFRYACLNANACKECVMLLDGRVVYACTARLEAREMRLDPLPNKRLLRDLATELAPPDEPL
jgi:succinate dehydrogenase/fumarate reductase-like Fe-S protein